SELAGVLRPLVGHEPESLDGFEVGETGIGFANDLREESHDAAITDHRPAIEGLQSCMPGPAIESGKVRRNERGDELVLVADQRNLGDHYGVFELVFDGLWSDKLASGGFEEFLLAIGDVEEAVLVEASDVAGREPAISVEALRVRIWLVPISNEDGRTANEKFTIVGKPEFHVGKRLANGAHAVDFRIVESDHGRCFGEAVALPDSDARGSEPLFGVDPEGSAAGDPDTHASAEGFTDFAEDELVGKFPDERRGLMTVVDGIAVTRSDAERPAEKSLFDRRERRLLLNCLADLLVDARNSDEDCGANLFHGLRELLEVGAVDDLGSMAVHHVIECAGGNVRER